MTTTSFMNGFHNFFSNLLLKNYSNLQNKGNPQQNTVCFEQNIYAILKDFTPLMVVMVVTFRRSKTNLSSPKDKVRVNDASEQVQLNASQSSSEAKPRSSSGKHLLRRARNCQF